MAWESSIDARAQEIFDAPEEDQGRLVNKMAKELRDLRYDNERLKERIKEFEHCFDDILKLKPFKERIDEKLRAQQRKDISTAQFAREAFYMENNYEYY